MTDTASVWTRPPWDSATERAFRAHMLTRLIPLGRLGFVIGASAFAGYLLWDQLFDPQAWRATLPFRLTVVALFAVAFALTYLPRFRTDTKLWVANLFVVYNVVSIGLALILAQLDGGFVAGLAGFIFGMIFVPLLVFSWTHALAITLPLVVVPVAVMALFGATSFTVINAIAWLTGGAGFAIGFAYLLDNINRRAFELSQSLDAERRRSDSLLLNILPPAIAERLKAEEDTIADDCPSATVLFADIVGFTELSRQMPAKQIVALLNDLYSRFDRLVERHGAEKIKTIGDAYMVAAGMPGTAADHAATVAALALDMRRAFGDFRDSHAIDLQLRIGVHSGAVVAGVIGERKFAYDLWGDTVNIASRMESHGIPDEIQISAATRDLLADDTPAKPRGAIDLKGHRTMQVYLLDPAS